MSLLYMESAARVRAQRLTDKYGNPSGWDWANAQRTTLAGVNVQPDGPSEESSGDRHSVVTGYRLISPRGTDLDILPTDRIEWRGLALELDGEPARFYQGGSLHHVEARLKRVSG